jgi:hypothetical protein
MASSLAFLAIGFVSGVFLSLPRFLLVLLSAWSIHTGFGMLWGAGIFMSAALNWFWAQIGFFCAVLFWLSYARLLARSRSSTAA